MTTIIFGNRLAQSMSLSDLLRDAIMRADIDTINRIAETDEVFIVEIRLTSGAAEGSTWRLEASISYRDCQTGSVEWILDCDVRPIREFIEANRAQFGERTRVVIFQENTYVRGIVEEPW